MDDLLPFSDMLAGFGLEIPKILNVNVFTEIVKKKLEELGYWEKVRNFGFLLPIVIAFGMSVAVNDYWSALKEGLLYGSICFALHDLNDRMKKD